MPPLVGFLSGGAFLWVVDKILPHLHPGFPTSEAEGIKTRWQRSVLLVSAITLHNVPEELAVGVAFGAAAAGHSAATLGMSIALAIGMELSTRFLITKDNKKFLNGRSSSIIVSNFIFKLST